MVHPFLLSFAKSGILTLTASQKHNLGRYKLALENKPSTKNMLLHSGGGQSPVKNLIVPMSLVYSKRENELNHYSLSD